MTQTGLHIAHNQSFKETDLLSRTARGEDAAFRELFDEYQPMLLSFVFKITKNLAATEEIVQDILLKIWMTKENLVNIRSFKNYSFTLARNQALNYIDKEIRRKNREEQFKKNAEAGYVGSGREMDDSIEDEKRPYHLIDEAINRLPNQQQTAWLLSRHEGLTYEEIAEQMNLSPKTVKRYIRIATDSMKEYISTHNLPLAILLASVAYL